MGLMRFLTPQRERVSAEAVERAYVAGLDGIPTHARKTWEGGELLRVEREIDESGNFYIPWDVEQHGPLVLCTASLMERERPYHLVVELARGTVNRLRSQAAVWQMAGLELPGDLSEDIHFAAATFARAATRQHLPQEAATVSEHVIQLALGAMSRLGRQYADQVLRTRHTDSSPLGTLLAGNLGDEPLPYNTEPMFGAAFNAAVVPFNWQRVEPEPDVYRWNVPDRHLQLCLRHRLKILAGPLMRLDADWLPGWAVACCTDFERLAARLRQFMTAVVQRYRGQARLWHCAAAPNLPGNLPLSDQERLRLTVMAIENVRRIDPRTPVIVSFDQPFAEYLVDDDSGSPPMHFADMLVRAELGLAGIGLEINLGYWPHGTLPRDLLEIGQLVDQWSLLGLPLIPMLCIPSGGGGDRLASQPARAFRGGDELPSLPSQKQLVEQLLPMLVAKQSVQAIVWNQVFDSVAHKFAHGGLFDASGRPKPSLGSLISLRRDHVA